MELARYHRTDGRCVPIRIQQILAQATPDPGFQPVQPGQAVESGVDYVQELSKSGSVYSICSRRS